VGAPDSRSSKTIPRSRIKAAAIAAGVVSGLCGVAAGARFAKDGLQADDLILSTCMAAAIFASMFLFILFALARMQTGIEWQKRGGRPDTFTRE
jgi:hypothetical protein